MAQKLILPINDARLTSGYKNANYQKQFGFVHYGIDLTSASGKKTIYGCGNGTIVACGTDSLFGGTVVISYDDCVLTDGTVKGIIQRIYHLDVVSVKTGQKITKDTVLGQYGNTGAYSTGAHLHLEFDTDVKYPCYTAGIAKDGTIIKRGTATSFIDPLTVMHVKKTAPDYQSVVGASNSDCYTSKDVLYKSY